jgi:hypothetical protein
MMQLLGCCLRTKRYFKKLLIHETEYSSNLLVLGNDKEIEWIANVPKDTLFLEKLAYFKNEDIKYKYKIWYSDQLYIKPSFQIIKNITKQKVECPWIWIGENETDMTNQLEEYVLDGNKIKIEFLNKLFPDIKKWSYICSKTLEVKDFPVEGIQIKHDSE